MHIKGPKSLLRDANSLPTSRLECLWRKSRRRGSWRTRRPAAQAVQIGISRPCMADEIDSKDSFHSSGTSNEGAEELGHLQPTDRRLISRHKT
eukprot:scaffold47_cov258-Pinguiococcus_pyrenoidosus.AAC.49